MRTIVEVLLNRLATRLFPAMLVGVTGLTLLWQLATTYAPVRQPVLIRVMEQTHDGHPNSRAEILSKLSHVQTTEAIRTRLSTKDFWFSFNAQAPLPSHPWLIDLPSRHISTVSCWEQLTDEFIGQASRASVGGQFVASSAGFALRRSAQQGEAALICRANFRGPAEMTVNSLTVDAWQSAHNAHQKTGALIEAGIGVLAVFMLLTAIVNRSGLYWVFSGWLLLNMRMAAVSAGTDFELFGLAIAHSLVIAIRQWTVCIYPVMTVALFNLLFKEELANIKSKIALTGLQLAAVLLVVVCPFLSFEQMLRTLWVATTAGVVIILGYLVLILRQEHSRVAVWYAASMALTLTGSMSEVIVAATGQRELLVGINSVTAAIASALLASAAVAEHMRADRLQKISAQRMLQSAYNDSPVGLFTLRDRTCIVKTNPAFQSMLDEMDWSKPVQLAQVFEPSVVHEIATMQSARPGASIELEARCQQHGISKWFSVKASTVDGGVNVEASLQDITQRVQATARLEFLANHDPLTEVLNLRGIARAFERAGQPPTALVYFDLDRFKLINDLYGHAAGDAVLKQVCERMRLPLTEDDLLARVGGDEFVIAFSKSTIESAHQRCQAVVSLISSAPYEIDSQSFSLSISGGLVDTERFSNSPLKEIIWAADTLCRRAKKLASERILVMGSDDTFLRFHRDELELITCFERNETPKGLFLVMQPELSLYEPFRSLNFEVLLRLRKPDGQVVPASVIIEAAEAHGKTAIIDRWVVTTAIAWLEEHATSLRNTRFVGINLSGGSLNDEVFTKELFVLLDKHPQASSKICIEITETVALTDMRHMQGFIDRARSIGVKVSLDDFGAGYSSFGYLKGLSVDALKLDGSLVRDAASSPAGMAIITALAGLASSLGMKSIGEFAEDLPTLKALVSAGADYAQGYCISKPVLPERILAARSGVDLIEDQEVLEYVTQLQATADGTLPVSDALSVQILQ